MLPFVFDKASFIIGTIENPHNLLNRIFDFKPDLILLDIVFCGKDGRIICHELKNNKLTCTIPIILISALAINPSETNYGQDLLVSKPFDITMLENEVKRLLKFN